MNATTKTVAALLLLSALVVATCGCTSVETSGTKLSFTTGTTHPSDVQELLKKGPVLIYFGGDCQSCKQTKVIISNLEKQYNGTSLTILRVNPLTDTARKDVNYGVTGVPTVVVIRGDGAVAKNVGQPDEQTLKNTIEDALKWK